MANCLKHTVKEDPCCPVACLDITISDTRKAFENANCSINFKVLTHTMKLLKIFYNMLKHYYFWNCILSSRWYMLLTPQTIIFRAIFLYRSKAVETYRVYIYHRTNSRVLFPKILAIC